MTNISTTGASNPPAGGTSLLGTFARLVRLEHALFSLPLFVSGALLPGRDAFPSWVDWILIAVAGTAARNLALALNRYIDRHIDAANPRTQVRELPSGQVLPGQVVLFMLFNAAVYAAAAWWIAPVCLYLSWIPVVAFTVYPFMKRFTVLCHFGVGAGLAMAPLGGYLAAAKSWPISEPAWMLALFTWLWVSGFDIIYAQADVPFDRQHGIHSLPTVLGKRALWLAAGLHLAAVGTLVAMWSLYFSRDLWLWLPIAAMTTLFALQHIRSDDVEFAAFKVNTWVGFVMLAFVFVGVF